MSQTFEKRPEPRWKSIDGSNPMSNESEEKKIETTNFEPTNKMFLSQCAILSHQSALTCLNISTCQEEEMGKCLQHGSAMLHEIIDLARNSCADVRCAESHQALHREDQAVGNSGGRENIHNGAKFDHRLSWSFSHKKLEERFGVGLLIGVSVAKPTILYELNGFCRRRKNKCLFLDIHLSTYISKHSG
jgi:hypothetical protein